MWRPRVEDRIKKLHNKYIIVEWYVKNGKGLHVEIRCLVDGNIFRITPSTFVKSENPCRECFIVHRNEGHEKDFRKSWEEAYTYLEFKIEKSQTQVYILCNDCGHKWWSSINNHKRDHGCMECFRASTFYTLEECEKIGREKHGDKYEYLDVYTDEEGNRCLKLKCKEHGEFKVIMHSHNIGGRFCPDCTTQRRKEGIKNGSLTGPPVYIYSLDECREKGNKIHNNKYDYIDVYTNEDNKRVLVLKCPVHGIFHQQVRYHLGCSHGCRDCADHGRYTVKNAEKNKEQWLTEHLKVYTIYCFDSITKEYFYKIGVTKNSVQSRYPNYATMPYQYQVIDVIETNMYDGTYLEKDLHNKHHNYLYKPTKGFGGSARECFSNIEHIDLNSINFKELEIYDKKRKEKREDEIIQ